MRRRERAGVRRAHGSEKWHRGRRGAHRGGRRQRWPTARCGDGAHAHALRPRPWPDRHRRPAARLARERRKAAEGPLDGRKAHARTNAVAYARDAARACSSARHASRASPPRRTRAAWLRVTQVTYPLSLERPNGSSPASSSSSPSSSRAQGASASSPQYALAALSCGRRTPMFGPRETQCARVRRRRSLQLSGGSMCGVSGCTCMHATARAMAGGLQGHCATSAARALHARTAKVVPVHVQPMCAAAQDSVGRVKPPRS